MKSVRAIYAKSSVTVKLLLPLLTVFSGLWGVGTLGVAYIARQNLESYAVQETDAIAARLLRSLEQNQKLLQSQARWVADRSDIITALEQRNPAQLQRLLLPLQAALDLDVIKVVEPKGNAIAALQQGALNQVTLADQKTRDAAGVGLELSDVIHAVGDAPATIAGVTSIKSQQKVLGGIIVGTALSDARLEELRGKPDKHLVVLQGAKVVASTLPAAKATDWRQLLANSTTQTIAIAQEDYLAKRVAITGDNGETLQLIVLKSAQSLQQAERNLGLLVGGFGVIGTGIVAIVAIFSNRITQRLTRQIRNLTIATQQVADHNFQDLIPVHSQDEIGKLSQSFNQMALQLRTQDQQIQQQMQTLEDTLNQLKQTQAQLIQSEKMSSLGQLVAGIAHEVNNPINFIHGNIDYAEQYFQDVLELIELYQAHYPDPADPIQDHLEAIDLDFLKVDLLKILHSMQVGTQRVQDIVRSLRTFSRLDESALKAVDVHQGIESTLLVLHNRLGQRVGHTEIKVEKDYAELPKVECYAGQLNQVLLNLLTNAIDALDTVEAPRISIRTYQPRPDWVGIAIADNGIGIAPDIQSRLFDPFFTTKPVGKGTGLGLSTSYQVIVNQHAGKLFCESELGAGTIFTLEIPSRLL